MFEHKTSPLLPTGAFFMRMVHSSAIGIALIAISLGLGVVGYHITCGLLWIDAQLDASMILAGMGPVNEIKSVGGKLLASFYTIYSGVAFLTMVAVILAPLIHRFLHRFHLAQEEDKAGGSPKAAPRRQG